MSEQRRQRPGALFWAALLTGLLVAYVVSSGLTRLVAVTRIRVNGRAADGTIISGQMIRTRLWWGQAYRPLVWAARTPPGRHLGWYWEQFPVLDDPQPPALPPPPGAAISAPAIGTPMPVHNQPSSVGE